MSSPDIFLCSDIHFGAEDHRLISAFLADVDASTADRRVVVIPGDLVQRGRKAEFAKARAFLRALRSRGVDVVLTPGNHDLGCWAHEHLPRPFNPGKVRSRFQKLWKAHLRDARQRDRTLVAARDMDAIHRVGDHVFVALRSVHRGRWGAPPSASPATRSSGRARPCARRACPTSRCTSSPTAACGEGGTAPCGGASAWERSCSPGSASPRSSTGTTMSSGPSRGAACRRSAARSTISPCRA